MLLLFAWHADHAWGQETIPATGVVARTSEDLASIAVEASNKLHCHRASAFTDVGARAEMLKWTARQWALYLRDQGFQILPLASGTDFIEVETEEATFPLDPSNDRLGYVHLRVIALLHLAAGQFDVDGYPVDIDALGTLIRKPGRAPVAEFQEDTFCLRVYPLHASFSSSREAAYGGRDFVEALPSALAKSRTLVETISRGLERLLRASLDAAPQAAPPTPR